VPINLEELAAGGGILNKAEVLAIIRRSNACLHEWIKAGIFPPPRDFGPPGGNRTAHGWLAEEVLAWRRNCPPRLPRGTVAVYGSGEANLQQSLELPIARVKREIRAGTRLPKKKRTAAVKRGA
jgi:predicted DNA-binding transcriptional regulator AlpA